MPVFSIWMLGESNLSISSSEELSGYVQGDGSHLVGETITFDSKLWTETNIKDNDLGFGEDEDIQRLHGETTIDGVTYSHNSIVEAEYILTVSDPSGTTYQFIGYNINEPGSPYETYGTVEGLALIDNGNGFPPAGVPLTVISSTDGPSNGIDVPVTTIYTPPCFTPGTMIQTPLGERPVEMLNVGDLVTTRDAGAKKILWIGSVEVSAKQQETNRDLRPILIRENAFGAGLPERDMRLSPQHRLLVCDDRAEMFFGAGEVLVAAKHLVDGDAVVQEAPDTSVTYLHLFCEDHQILFADGLEAESFRPGAVSLKSLPDASREEFLELFPEFSVDSHPATEACRPMLKSWEAEMLRRDVA